MEVEIILEIRTCCRSGRGRGQKRSFPTLSFGFYFMGWKPRADGTGGGGHVGWSHGVIGCVHGNGLGSITAS